MSSFIQRIIPSLLALVALQNWRLFALLLPPSGSDATVLTVVGLLLVLLVLAVVGLWKRARWGFVAFYVLVPVATLLHSIALIPGITSMLPQSLRPIAMLLINGGLLASVAASHRIFGVRFAARRFAPRGGLNTVRPP